MRKLIESTLVSLDGVIEAPERWATFDAEATPLSLEQLGSYDAFVGTTYALVSACASVTVSATPPGASGTSSEPGPVARFSRTASKT